MQDDDGRTYRGFRVWDRTTRWFHWINVLCVLGLAAVGTAILEADALGIGSPGKILLKSVHVSIGYAFAANLAWRLVWAFIGGPFARWRALLPGGKGFRAAAAAYVAGVRAGDAPRYLGHNPLARIAVAGLLLLLVVQAVTGLMLAGTDLYWPPLGGSIAAWVAAPGVAPASLVPYDKSAVDEAAFAAMRALRTPFIVVHYWTFWLLCLGVAIHVVAVVVSEIREPGALISAMFSGRKLLDKDPVDGPPGA